MTNEEQIKHLNNTLKEIKKFASEAIYPRSKDLLNKEISQIESEIVVLQKSTSVNESPKIAPVKPQRSRFVTDLRGHAFDESDKYAKIFIPFSDESIAITEDNVQFDVDENSFKVFVTGENKDYRFNVCSLLKPIDVSKSYRKVKTDMISVYLKKVKEGEKWTYLTLTEKRLKDQSNKTFDDVKEDDAEKDPMGGLMNIMKTMYERGDPELKRTIAKAWTEGQDKSRHNQM